MKGDGKAYSELSASSFIVRCTTSSVPNLGVGDGSVGPVPGVCGAESYV